METKDKVAVLIWDNCHIKTSKLCATKEIGRPVVIVIKSYENLVTEKSVQGSEKILTVKHKTG
jgi:hypothetical protein